MPKLFKKFTGAYPSAQGRPFKLVKSTQTGKTAAETARTTVSKERSGVGEEETQAQRARARRDKTQPTLQYK